jgi:sterol 3beta-glucosyltransferase
MADQPFWGRQIHRLGASPPPIPHKLLTAKRLAQAITTAMESDSIQQRCVELGNLIRAEDGVGRAVGYNSEGYLEGA